MSVFCGLLSGLTDPSNPLSGLPRSSELAASSSSKLTSCSRTVCFSRTSCEQLKEICRSGSDGALGGTTKVFAGTSRTARTSCERELAE